MTLNILHDGLGSYLWIMLGLQRVVNIGAMDFITRGNVDRLAEGLAVALFHCAAIDHDRRAVVAGEGHDNAWHVLVTTWDSNAGVVVLGTGHSLDGVRNDLA